MSAMKSRDTGTKTKKNRPDAPIYMPPAIRNIHLSASKSTIKENE